MFVRHSVVISRHQSCPLAHTSISGHQSSSVVPTRAHLNQWSSVVISRAHSCTPQSVVISRHQSCPLVHTSKGSPLYPFHSGAPGTAPWGLAPACSRMDWSSPFFHSTHASAAPPMNLPPTKTCGKLADAIRRNQTKTCGKLADEIRCNQAPLRRRPVGTSSRR